MTIPAEDYRPLQFGEALKLRYASSNRNPHFALGALGGRYVLMCVVADLAAAAAQAALRAIAPVAFDETLKACIVFCAAPGGGTDALVAEAAKTKLVFDDPSAEAARDCALLDPRLEPQGRWILFDPGLRVMALWPLAGAEQALAALAALPHPDQHAGAPLHAPVLIAPRIFESSFCDTLVAYYAKHGGIASGITKNSPDGKTFITLADDFKRREDCMIEDALLREHAMHRVFWRLLPEIEKCFAWRATRMERYIVSRYNAESGGFFRPHRDNTTKGTAHRRFAVTINLNTGEYDGGDLRFPEFGSRTYRAPRGGAVVFSCGLLHEATPITRGERYAFLPFLYDEEGVKTRAANNPHLDPSAPRYEGALS
jgi:2OG-Fe(II) oxygenase superfamily